VTTAAVVRHESPQTTSIAHDRAPGPVLREARPADAAQILRLIEAHRVRGHLLPRRLEDLVQHAPRFCVLEEDDRIVGCAELAPLSRAVAEVRSLVVDEAWQHRGLGLRLIEEVSARARAAGYSVLCAFTHEPRHFVRLGFSIVPHVWFPEKVALDCTGCDRFRVCGQQALALALTKDGELPTERQLRAPLSAARSATKRASLPPVRLKVIA
jgi:N-acetylglutamate synthase-like GNAT family acetyltransferase